MLPENPTGRCENRNCRAFGPPVETPMAIMLVGAAGFCLRLCGAGRVFPQTLGLNRAVLGGCLYLLDQFLGDLRHACGNVVRFGHKIEGAERQRLERDGGPRCAVRTDHDNGHAPAPHDFLQGVDAVQPRHFEIERHYVWCELVDLLQGKMAVDRGAHYLDRGVAFENLGNQPTHQSGIVDDQHAHGSFLHACPPAAAARGATR